MPQSPFVFGGSIRHNIALADPSLPFDRVVAATAPASTPFRAMPMGYETIVADAAPPCQAASASARAGAP